MAEEVEEQQNHNYQFQSLLPPMFVSTLEIEIFKATHTKNQTSQLYSYFATQHILYEGTIRSK